MKNSIQTVILMPAGSVEPYRAGVIHMQDLVRIVIQMHAVMCV